MFWLSTIPFSIPLWMLIWLLLFTPHAHGQVIDLTVKLKMAEQATRLATLESLILREQIITQQLEKVRADQQALYAETCKAAGIEADPKLCAIDLSAKTVTRREPAKEGTK